MDYLWLYKIVDKFFYIFHVALIIFNLFGWIPKSLRRWNLLTLLMTAFSWFVLGIFYGFGYCFFTDWHWQVREKLGYATDSNSYIHFLLTQLTPLSVREDVVDLFTGVLFFLALLISVYVNVRSMRRNWRG
ncbi:MAG: DUF2784 family protein [Cyclobacteriaceae bacterium]